MLKLFFDLKYQNITLTNPGVTVASDSKNYLVAKFNAISNDWETPLSAIFVSTVDKVAYTVLVGQSANLEADECYVPWEVLKDSGEVYVSVFSGNLHTTNVAKFAVVKSGYVEGEIPPPPTPTVYEQILEELENKQDVIHLDNAIDEVYNPNGHYVLYYFDSQDIRHNIFDFKIFQELTIQKIYEILDQTLQGAQNVTPSLYVEPKGDNYALVYEDSEDVKHELFDFSNLPIGGTSDYTELENKPSINNATLQGNKTSNELGLQPLINNYFTVENNEYIGYNFNSVSAGANSVLYCVPFGKISNFPNSLVSKISQSGKLYIFHYVHYAVGARYLIRRIMGYDLNGKYAEFAQYCTVGNENTVISQSDWAELTGSGSQIVSGVVNANGTITFTDSDGNTFTTTGASVIGADGLSPVATVTQTASGATVTITDKNGTTAANISNGADGQDYVLTAQDKSDIADIVLSELPTTQGVLYGNTSN